jgi:phage head maturation protease
MEHGELFANIEDRTVRGLLIPYGELSRTNMTKTEPIMFSRGTIAIPRDPTMVGLNVQHDRFTWAGRGVTFEDTDEGLVATFSVAETDEGDEALAAVQSGRLKKLSAEVVDMVRKGASAVSAKLTGAALVTEGAWASAELFALGDVTDENDEETTAEAPATEDDEPDEEPDEDEEEAVAEASASEVMLAGRAPASPKVEPYTRSGLFALLDRVKQGQASARELAVVQEAFKRERESGMFALDDITYNAAGDIAPLLPKQWIGEVEDGTTYQQTFVGLFGAKPLTSLYLQGWKWNAKPYGGTWTGNKAEVPSNIASFTAVTDTATRWAGANDIAREHRDFGTPGFFEAYDRLMRQSFATWLDETIVKTEAFAAATDLEADNPTGLTIGAGWSQLIDGAIAIVGAGLTPTGAVISTSLAKGMLKFPQSDILGYLSGALGLEGGSLDGFQFRFSSLVTTDHILVVSKGAADVYTLPGSPVRAEALNIANGGVDVGYFGYGGFLVNNALGIVDVAPYTA